MTRFLEDNLWLVGKTSIAAMPRDTVRDQEHYVRVHRPISLLYLIGLRISEVVSIPIGGFFGGGTAMARTAGGWRSPAKATRNACYRQRGN